MIRLDTSVVVVRHLVGSPPEQGERARVLVDGPEDLDSPLVTLVETAVAAFDRDARRYGFPTVEP